jgi:hypothetical protein
LEITYPFGLTDIQLPIPNFKRLINEKNPGICLVIGMPDKPATTGSGEATQKQVNLIKKILIDLSKAQ